MKRLIPLTSGLALALAVSGAAMAQNGNGNGNGNGHGNGNGGGNHGQEARGGGNDNRGGERGNGRADRAAEIAVPQAARDIARARGEAGQVRDMERQVRGQVEQRVEAAERVITQRRGAGRALLNGCPPGLAKRDNGCLPPGQARQIERAQDPQHRYNYLWRTSEGEGDYRYRDGYLYRNSADGGLLGYLPVLGGALSPGNTWPSQYAYQQPAQQVAQYFGLKDQNQYRYADGVLYGVDPQTQSISQVAALLTGQQFNVGQPMPAGYDVYNVPHAYRDQYADTAQSQYRYNDGAVYQVDPTTRMVQAVIQLLT